MNKLPEVNATKLSILKRRARLRAVDVLHSAYAEAHEKYGMTKADFAHRINMEPSQLSRILSGAQNVSVEMVEGVLRAFESRLTVGYEPLHKIDLKASNRYPRAAEEILEIIDASPSVPRHKNFVSKYKTDMGTW